MKRHLSLHVVVTACFLAIVLISLSTQRRVDATTLAAQQTQPATASATLDPGGMDMKTATTYHSSDGAVEIQMPRGWQEVPDPEPWRTYSLDYGKGTDSNTVFVLQIGFSTKLLGLTGSSVTPQQVLEALKAQAPTVEFGKTYPVKLDKYEGLGQDVTIKASDQLDTVGHGEVWIVVLPDGRVMELVIGSTISNWQKAQPVLHQMAASTVLHPEKSPTATPYPTIVLPTSSPVPTLNPTMLSLKKPTPYISYDGAVELQIPDGWTSSSTNFNLATYYEVQYGAVTSYLLPYLTVIIGPGKAILEKDTDVDTTQEALDAFKAKFGGTVNFSLPYPVKLAQYDGLGVAYSGDVEHEGLVKGEIWVAVLGNHKLVVVNLAASIDDWPAAQAVLKQIAATLVLHPEKAATITPVPTLTATP